MKSKATSRATMGLYDGHKNYTAGPFMVSGGETFSVDLERKMGILHKNDGSREELPLTETDFLSA